MKLFNSASLLSLALCSTLVLSACNKAETEAPATATDTAVVTDTAATDTVATDTTASTTTAPVATSSSSESGALAKMMSDQIMQAIITPAIMSGGLNAEQQACLENTDENLGVAETQAYLNDTFTADEIEAMNEAYSSDLMKRINQYSQEQMAIMSGKTVENPTAAPTEEEMKEFAAMYDNDPRMQRVKEMNENLDPDQNEFMNALRPVINGEFERCNFPMKI